MLAKRHIIAKKKDFDAVKEKGKIYATDHFSLSILKKTDNEQIRFGFVVSTKISPHASVRNRIKRALAEGARFSLYKLKPKYDVVVLVKPSIVKVYTSEIMKEMQYALEKSGLTKSPPKNEKN